MEIVDNCPSCGQKLVLDYNRNVSHGVCPKCEAPLTMNPPETFPIVTNDDKRGAFRIITIAIYWHVKLHPSAFQTADDRDKLLKELCVAKFCLKYQLYLKKSPSRNVQEIYPSINYCLEDNSAFIGYSTGYVRPDIQQEMVAYLREIFRPFAVSMG